MISLSIGTLKSAMRNGGVFIMVVTKRGMRNIIYEMEKSDGNTINVIECETVGDAEKAILLVQAFNKWNLEEIREFMKKDTTLRKVETEL